MRIAQQLNDAAGAVHGSVGIPSDHDPSSVVRGVFVRDEHFFGPPIENACICPRPFLVSPFQIPTKFTELLAKFQKISYEQSFSS